MRPWRRRGGGQLATQLLRLFWLLPVLFVFTINFALVLEDDQPARGLLRLAYCEKATANRTTLRTLSRNDAKQETEAEKLRQQQKQQPVISNDNKQMPTASSKNKQQANRVKAKTNAQQIAGQLQEQQRSELRPTRIQKGASQATGLANKHQNSADLHWKKPARRPPQQDEPLDFRTNGDEPARHQAGDPSSLQDESQEDLGSAGGLQVSITPRVSLVRVPVESNAILKCLISSQANKFTKPFKVSWSRYRHQENDYEQIESESYETDTAPAPTTASATNSNQARERAKRAAGARKKRNDEAQLAGEQQADFEANHNASFVPDSQLDPPALINRQQQLRDFLARSRQETNAISDLLVEATLSISPVKASDNASYFCTATHKRSASEAGGQQQQAQIDLLALSKPEVRLERVQPARDSKSALVFWFIVSDGNTPIHKTVLMVRNDSQTLELRQANRYKFQHQQATQESQQQSESGAQQHRSSLVLDGDYNQWQRIDIPADGSTSEELAQEETRENRRRRPPPAAYPAEASLAEDSVVRADVDVTSINLDRGHNQSDIDYFGSGAGNSRRRVREPRRSYNLSHLLPGVSYQLRLAALNDMGQSEWSQMAATMPNEIPAQISELRVLSATNDSLTIGWRRPPYDGARTIRYEMQLFDLNRTMTLDANTNTNSSAQQTQRSAFMFHFVSLQPGTDYHFHIRACSRAGCSAYSTPKLAASTLDGEPDEPLDAELTCEPAIGQLQVTWLPPVQLRGRLLNYTVTLEAQSRYRNQSGQWTSEQRQARLDTADNHTLSLEFGSNQQQQHQQGGWPAEGQMHLMPNTNYTARVCANNRSPRCGKWSQVSSKARCSTPAELPVELPANIRLGLKQLKLIDVEQTKAAAETLVLELPFVSWRNGSIDCIQVILIRLPNTFDSSRRALSEFLPDDPAQIKLHEFLDLIDTNATAADQLASSSSRMRDSQEALAYLAEELDQINQSGSNEELASGLKQILLGDGVQSTCSQVWAKLSQQQKGDAAERKWEDEAGRKSMRRDQEKDGVDFKPFMRAVDGSLIAESHYTGFLKLVQLRQAAKRQSAGSMRRRSIGNLEVLTKYSNYFSPVKTGQQVPEVSIESLLSNNRQLANYASGEQTDMASNELEERFCESKLAVSIQSRLGTDGPCKMAASVAGSIKRISISSYKKLSSFLGEHLRLDSLTKLFSSSSPPLQLLEMGLLVFVGASFLLFVIYLFTLPSGMRRKRKRQEIKRQLQEHEALALAGSQKCGQEAQQDEPAGFVVQQQEGKTSGALLQQQQPKIMQPNLQALASSLGYQQVLEPADDDVQAQLDQQAHASGYGTMAAPKECPIHSSPMSQVVSSSHQQEVQQHSGSDTMRRQSVHVCQRAGAIQPEHDDYAGHANSHNQQEQQLLRHHHHHHHRSAYHIHQDDGSESANNEWNEARNCRTMRHPHQQNASNGFSGPFQVGHHHEYEHEQHANQFATYGQHQQPAAQANYTMTMQHDTVLGLAKKINKSLPLSLFPAIFECRLKSGWLREEYEQLPRLANLQMQPALAKINEDGKHIKLRPQLIVSRDDSVSALISGNDKYDGSLVKIQLPALGNANGAAHMVEKQFICAKSPTDADSVWDFWRLIYEQEVSSLVMLTPNEDTHTGELRCAQYWPTCDNEETTILSPCNEYVQQSSILPAKFKIRQETLSGFEIDGEQEVRSDEFKIRRLTLLVMATRPNENEQTNATTNEDTSKLDLDNSCEPQKSNGTSKINEHGQESLADKKAERNSNEDDFIPDDEESLVIIERNLLHFQFLHWNASSSSNQMRLIKFIELVNEKHSRLMQQQASPGTHWQQVATQNPILVHCANGIGRSGLFTAMSLVIDDLSFKLSTLANSRGRNQQQQMQQQNMVAKINLFHLVSKLRCQRDMLLSPYRFYELFYQLTTRCIPAQHNHHYYHQHKGREQVSTISAQAPS